MSFKSLNNVKASKKPFACAAAISLTAACFASLAFAETQSSSGLEQHAAKIAACELVDEQSYIERVIAFCTQGVNAKQDLADVECKAKAADADRLKSAQSSEADVVNEEESVKEAYAYAYEYPSYAQDAYSYVYEQPAQTYAAESSGYVAGTSNSSSSFSSFQSDGVWYDGNYRYTWYSSNQLYHYQTSEWTAGDDGIYRDSDGYVVVASSTHAKGDVIEGTSFGDVKVYDSGCAAGTLDVYTNY